MDLARPLVRQHRLEVVRVADHRVLQRDPGRAQDRAGGPRDLERLAHVVELAHAHVLGSQTALVLHPAEMQREQRSLVQLRRHVRELLLRELEPGDRPPPLHARLRVLERAGEARARRAHRPPDDPEPRLGQARERALHARDAEQPRPRARARRRAPAPTSRSRGARACDGCRSRRTRACPSAPGTLGCRRRSAPRSPRGRRSSRS